MKETNIMTTQTVRTTTGREIQDPPVARFLFSDTRMAPVWLVIRVLLGWEWLSHGLEKFNNPAWMDTGLALKGFWENAVKIPEQGRPAIAFGWYRDFLQSMLDAGSYTWFSKLVVFGEILIGIALILGLFVGIAAFFAAFMNWNFIMAGSASTNGFLAIVALFILLAWKVAGYYGLDYFLLPRLGTPWQPVVLETTKNIPTPPPAPTTSAQGAR
jgi:thiosulfate dehydrogenase (quinone) large subunit